MTLALVLLLLLGRERADQHEPTQARAGLQPVNFPDTPAVGEVAAARATSAMVKPAARERRREGRGTLLFVDEIHRLLADHGYIANSPTTVTITDLPSNGTVSVGWIVYTNKGFYAGGPY